MHGTKFEKIFHVCFYLFRHSVSGDQINLTQTANGKFRFVGFRSDKIDKLLGNKKYEDLIEDGVLVKLGTKKYLRKNPGPPNRMPMPIIRKKPVEITNTAPISAQSNSDANGTNPEMKLEPKQEKMGTIEILPVKPKLENEDIKPPTR